jgi:Peptidase C39 family/ABC transporter transmembrane region
MTARETCESAIEQFLTPFFSDPKDLERWVSLFNIKPMLLGDPLMRSSLDSNLYMICSGRVRLVCLDHQQRPISVQMLEAGQWFGEPACHDDSLAPQKSSPLPAVSSSSNNIIDFPHRHPFQVRLPRLQPFIAQQSASDCGIACLSMIGQYWGKRYSIYTLRELSNVGRSGITLKNLGSTAEQLGFHTRPVRASLHRMAEQRNPWIAHWQGDHFIVVYQIKAQKVLVADPAMGKRWIKKSLFIEGWTNFALLLEPGPELLAIEDKPGKSLGTFWSLLMTYKGLLLQIVALSFLLQLFGLITPLFTQVILDQVVTQKSLPALHIFSIGLVLFTVWQVGLGGVRQYLLDYFSNRLDLTMLSGFISHSLPLKFFEDRTVGDIITRIQENTKIQNFLMPQAISTWLDASMAVVYLGLMLSPFHGSKRRSHLSPRSRPASRTGQSQNVDSGPRFVLSSSPAAD